MNCSILNSMSIVYFIVIFLYVLHIFNPLLDLCNFITGNDWETGVNVVALVNRL